MNSGKFNTRIFWMFFFALLIIITSIASIVYFSQRKTVRYEKSGELKALFKLKEIQFLDWKHERESDAFLINTNPERIHSFEKLINSPQDTNLISYFDDFSRSRISTGHYESLILTDRRGIPVIAFPDSVKHEFLSFSHLHDLDSAGKTDEIIMTNLHFTSDSQIIFHFIIPLTNSIDKKTAPFGFLLLNIDPVAEFYPLLQTFQTYSKTAEALLVRKENNQIIFQNELRHVKGAALRMKFPDESKDLAAAKAVRGETGIVDAIDYRNKKILAAIGPIEGTPWYLVVKIDTSELYGDLRRFGISTLLISLLLLVAGYLTIRIIWIRRSLIYEKQKLLLEHNYQLFKHKFSLVSKYANDAILLWDHNFSLLDVNDKALELYGYDEVEMIGISEDKLRPENLRQELENSINFLKNKDGIRYETMHQHKNGTIFPVEVSTRRFSIDDKLYFQSIVHDITDRKKVESIIRENEIKFRYLFENIDTCVAVYEAIDDGEDFIFKDFNKAAEKVENTFKNDILGKRVTEVFPGIVNFGLLEIFRKVWLSGIPIEFPAKIYKDNHITGWRENYVYKLPNGEIVTVYRDLTSEKRMLKNLEENEERLRLALKAARQGLYDMNIQTGEAIVSPEYETMLGYEPGKLQETNKKWQERLHPDDRIRVYKVYEDYVTGRIEEYQVEFRQKTQSGGWVWILSTGEIVSFDPQGKPLRMLGIHTDITQLKFAEDEIIKLNAELEQKVKERTDQLAAKNHELETFAYSVSHDLKAPLRGIDGYSRLLVEEYSNNLNNEAKQFIQNIRESTLQMDLLIEDLLNYSRLERYKLNPVKIDIYQITKNTVAQILKEYPETKALIDINFQKKELKLDPDGLGIILRNLIENAVKFTKTVSNPKIEIGLEKHNHSTVLYVRDNGIGFDMQYHNRIFEIFQRLQRAEDYPGTGIGLAMVKKAMERMGGTIWAESSTGKGSVFYIEFPNN